MLISLFSLLPKVAISQSHKVQVLPFDTSVLVEEKDIKGSKGIRMQQIGNRKEVLIRFEVSRVSLVDSNQSV